MKKNTGHQKVIDNNETMSLGIMRDGRYAFAFECETQGSPGLPPFMMRDTLIMTREELEWLHATSGQILGKSS